MLPNNQPEDSRTLVSGWEEEKLQEMLEHVSLAEVRSERGA